MVDQPRERDAHPTAPAEAAVTVRSLHRDDFTSYAALLWEGDRVHYDALPELLWPPDEARPSEEDFCAFLDDADVLMIGTDVDGTLAGMVRATYRERAGSRLHMPSRSVKVDDLIVGVSFRRRGIARALLTRVEHWARGRRAQSVELRVYAFNVTARELYEQLGYRALLHQMTLPLD